VLLPGSGSDDVFITAAFAEPLATAGIGLLAPRPRPGLRVVDQLRAELGSAAVRYGSVLAGGVSLGAHIATSWAIRNPGRCAGLLVALPAWTGMPGDAPASVAGIATARAIGTAGVESALASARVGAPAWLADELDRAWRGYGPALATSLRVAATTPGPGLDELRRLDLPVGVVALTDDPLHPLDVARVWARALPRAALVTTTLAAVGQDRRALGHAALLAWRLAHAGQP
jgi:pimeloyl-ACP methyl ester carboxylesterase